MQCRKSVARITAGIALAVTAVALAAGGGTLKDPQESYSNSWRGVPTMA